MLIRFFAVLCLGLLLSSTATADYIFTDNFNAGPAAQWGNEVGNWAASGGVYSAQAPSNNPLTYSSLPFNLTDFTVSVDVNDIQDGGIWLRSPNSANGILLVTGGADGGGTGLYWHEVVGGAAGNILNPSGPFFSSGVSDVTIRVDVIGNTFTAYVNGTLATSLTSNLYTSGRVALYDFSGQTFDNLTISAVPEPNTVVLAFLVGVGYLVPRYRRRCRWAHKPLTCPTTCQ